MEADAVIGPAAAGDRVFFRQTQARQGLPGIHDARPGARHRIHELAGVGGYAGEELEGIEAGALRREQGPGRAGDFAQQLIGGHPLPVLDVPVQGHVFADPAESLVEPGGSGQYRRFPGDNRGFAHLPGGNELGGQIPGSHIFGQGGIHIAINFSGRGQDQFHGGLSSC